MKLRFLQFQYSVRLQMWDEVAGKWVIVPTVRFESLSQEEAADVHQQISDEDI